MTKAPKKRSSAPSCAPAIHAALRNGAHLPVESFAIILHLENGEERTFTSVPLAPFHPWIFSGRFREDFRDCIRQAKKKSTSPGSVNQEGEVNQEEGNTSPEFHTNVNPKFSSSGSRQSGSNDTGSGKGKGKRLRGSPSLSFDNDDTPVPAPVVRNQLLNIRNEAEVEHFYFARFRDMQQASCKIMGKVFIKLLEPKKQTFHPYSKGAEAAPLWWPETTGKNGVRHREPDHLLRGERIRLLVHILKMLILPYEQQCPTVQKLGLNVQKLEDVTTQAMSGWLNDTEHPENLAKEPYLEEIFEVAKAEEQYKKGEIGTNTLIAVMYVDRNRAVVRDDDAEVVKDGDKEADTAQIPTNMLAPDSMVSQPIMQDQHPPQEQVFNGMLMGPTVVLPMRYHSQPVEDENLPYSNSSSSLPRTTGVGFQAQPVEDENLPHSNSSSLPRTTGVGFQAQPVKDENLPYSNSSSLPQTTGDGFQAQFPNSQDPSCHSFASPPFYPSPQSTYGWQNTTMASNAVIDPNYSLTSPQPPFNNQDMSFQPPPPPGTQEPMFSPMMPHPFDNSTMGPMDNTGSLDDPHDYENFFH